MGIPVEKLEKGCDLIILGSGILLPVGIVLGNAGFEALAALGGAAWLLRALISRDQTAERVANNPLFPPWLFWFGTIIISLIINGPGAKGAAHDLAFVRFLLFGLALMDLSTRRPVGIYLAWGLGIGVLFALLNTSFAYGLGHDLLGRPLARYTGKLKEAARYSGLCCYAAVFFAAWALGDSGLSRLPKKRAVLLAMAALAFAQVLQTQVRTAVLGLLAGLAFVFFFGQAKRFGVFKTLLAVFALFAALGLAFWHGEWWNMESMYDRWSIWQVSWEIWKEHPMAGTGVSAFQDAFARVSASGVAPPFTAPDGRVYFNAEQTHAHNLFLMIGSCTGVFGLAAFSWLFVRACMLVYAKPAGWRHGLAGWPIALVVMGLTGFNIYHSWYQALFAFFLALAGSREPISETKSPDLIMDIISSNKPGAPGAGKDA